MQRTPTVLVLAVFLLFCSPAFGQRPGLSQAKKQKKSDVGGMVDARFGYGFLAEDQFLSLNVGTALTYEKLGVGLQVPLRFRVVDNEPEDNSTIRSEDWDEVSDWTRVLRYVEWGNPQDDFYTRLGVLIGATLGHGTIVDRYYNVIDADHYQTGVQVNLDMDVAGGQFMLDNMIDPNIFAARGYLRPFEMAQIAPALKKFAVGVTLAVDGAAPNNYKTVTKAYGIKTLYQKQLNSDREVEVTETSTTLLGLDLEWEVYTTERVALTPYIDLNLLASTGGAGFHAGLLSSFKMGQSVHLGTRLEYRAVEADYSPSYINSWYEVERVAYLDGKTKNKYFQDRDDVGDDETLHGFLIQADLDVLKAFSFGIAYDDYQGPDNANLLLRLSLPWIAGIRLNTYYAKRNMDGLSEAFDFDNALAVAELKWKFFGPMYAYIAYSREWRVNKDQDELRVGEYETIDDFDAGVGAEFTF